MLVTTKFHATRRAARRSRAAESACLAPALDASPRTATPLSIIEAHMSINGSYALYTRRSSTMHDSGAVQPPGARRQIVF